MYKHEITNGLLELELRKELMPLASLLDFASRINPKRGYLFVSKVLGKHIPCRPSLMLDVQTIIAQQLKQQSNTLFIGMAETAVGLGAGVAQAYATDNDHQALFIQTTRYPLDAPLLLRFEEPHSHAVAHLLYEPQPQLREQFYSAEQIILVDDEISTGNTMMNLARALIDKFPNISRITFATIVNWLSDYQRHLFQEQLSSLGVELSFVSLIDGSFHFTATANMPTATIKGAFSTQVLSCVPRADTGRRGMIPPKNITLDHFMLDGELDIERPVQVIGTGEFMHIPQWLALSLEQQGYDVLYQSTTRSPIKIADAITAMVSCNDEFGQGINNYLYNPSPFSVSSLAATRLVCYEQINHANTHTLFSQARVSAIYQQEKTQ